MVLSILLTSSVALAQSTAQQNIQPKIMVIPRVPDGQDMKVFYDSSVNTQIALAKINEAFQKRGANLRNFDQALKQVRQNEILNKAAGNQEDVKSRILSGSSADISVEVKIDVVSHPGRNAKSVNIIMDASHVGTANSLASKVFSSPMFQTEDIGLLTMKAIEGESEAFLNLLQKAFDNIRENGQSVNVEFAIASASKYTFDSEVKGQLLSELIDEWFQNNAVKGVYNNQGVVENRMIISDVKIPLKKKDNPNVNYTGQTLFSDLSKFFKAAGVETKRVIGNNNKILITIL